MGLLAAHPGAAVFAGATDLIPQIQGGRPEPSLVVDLKRIPETARLAAENGFWRVGAAVPAAALTANAALVASFPGLVEAAGLIGSDQIQGRADTGRQPVQRLPCGRLGPPSGGSRRRGDHRRAGRGAVDAGFRGRDRAGRNIPGPCRVHHRIPDTLSLPGIVRRLRAVHSPHRDGTSRVVGAAARIRVDGDGRCQEASVVLAAVAPTVVEVGAASGILEGRVIPEDSGRSAFWDELGEAVVACCNPIDDKRGTAEFRRKVAQVLARRTVVTAARRARETL